MALRLLRRASRAAASSRASRRWLSAFRDEYVAHVEERKAQGLVPKPLDPGMCAQLVEQLVLSMGEFAQIRTNSPH